MSNGTLRAFFFIFKGYYCSWVHYESTAGSKHVFHMVLYPIDYVITQPANISLLVKYSV